MPLEERNLRRQFGICGHAPAFTAPVGASERQQTGQTAAEVALSRLLWPGGSGAPLQGEHCFHVHKLREIAQKLKTMKCNTKL